MLISSAVEQEFFVSAWNLCQPSIVKNWVATDLLQQFQISQQQVGTQHIDHTAPLKNSWMTTPLYLQNKSAVG